MKLGLLLLLSLALGACAMAPVAPRASLFEDGAFAPPSEPVDAKAIFALSPEMRQFLDTYIRPSVMRSLAREQRLDHLCLAVAAGIGRAALLRNVDIRV